jgi:lipopolysaccharide export system permease protein
MTRKSSATIGIAIGLFFVYWAALITGEELADRLRMDPVLAMWAPNVLLGMIGLWITSQVSRERRVWNLDALKEHLARKKLLKSGSK